MQANANPSDALASAIPQPAATTAHSLIQRIKLRPNGQLAVERAPADAHQVGCLRAVTAGLDQGLAEQAFFILLDREGGA